MEVLIEQITLANKNRFGRSSEKTMDTSQICFMEPLFSSMKLKLYLI